MGSRSTAQQLLELSTGPVALEIVRNARARRLSLRVDPASGQPRLVMPSHAALADGLTFVRRNAAWLERQLKALPVRIPFENGRQVPVLGDDHVIRHIPEARRGVWRVDGTIWVSGQSPHIARRVTDYLRREARHEITTRAFAKAREIRRPIRRIVLRDTRTRWGSCSADGALNFCWRLVMAPASVLDYVVAHEVAHLVHMNHSRKFWSLVATLTEDPDGPRSWLRQHGGQLHRYG